MSLIEITGREQEYSRQYQLGHLLTLVLAAVVLLYGLNIRSGILFATTPYTNIGAGVQLRYPANWLIDNEGDYIFRVRDMTRIGFKTTMQIALHPVSNNMTERNVVDSLTISRASEIPLYNVLAIENYTLPDETQALAVSYSLADTETNPFLQSLPSIVSGLDIIVIRGGQAIVVTFRADAETFDDDVDVFLRLLNSLDLEF